MYEDFVFVFFMGDIGDIVGKDKFIISRWFGC